MTRWQRQANGMSVQQRLEEAETAAEEALCARIRFWDGVLAAIEAGRGG